ncbi:hypothetical protein Tco_0337398 [Tanacetum coccineum]
MYWLGVALRVFMIDQERCWLDIYSNKPIAVVAGLGVVVGEIVGQHGKQENRPHDRVPQKEMKTDWRACLDNKVRLKVANWSHIYKGLTFVSKMGARQEVANWSHIYIGLTFVSKMGARHEVANWSQIYKGLTFVSKIGAGHEVLTKCFFYGMPDLKMGLNDKIGLNKEFEIIKSRPTKSGKTLALDDSPSIISDMRVVDLLDGLCDKMQSSEEIIES